MVRRHPSHTSSEGGARGECVKPRGRLLDVLLTVLFDALVGALPNASKGMEYRQTQSLCVRLGSRSDGGMPPQPQTHTHRVFLVHALPTAHPCAAASRLVLLNGIKPGRQEAVEVWNSPLNEAAALGFEYGYSLGARDNALVIWEAQFGAAVDCMRPLIEFVVLYS